ncbi:MAG TPA: SGNH/GDSL hydrolase family protein [Planctomycetota bacterium]|nr:SGNH/GDSL hydrolase family protein [Planctomycetota bacterium]
MPALKPLKRSLATPLDPDCLPWKEKQAFVWYDGIYLTLAGKGWPKESRRYERFPKRAEGKIPEKPWRQSLACAGLSLRFSSDATFFFLRTVDYDGRKNINQISMNSPSLYVHHHGRWQWLGLAKMVDEGQNEIHKLVNGAMPKAMREYILYLPLGRGMTKLELGIPADAKLIPTAPRTEKPVVFYGTSINHGGNASRPGTNHIALLERHFDYPMVNLGLSGSACMEPEVIDLVREIDARLFVIDCLPNMQAPQVRERFAPAIKKLRAKHPKVPIIVVDNVIYQDGFLVIDRYERYTQSNAAQQEEFAKLVAAGVPNLHYVYGRELFTDADEATVDGTHPNDHGFRLMADTFIKVLTPFMP